MNDFKLITPVAFLIYNRPDLTKKVFEEIRKAKPPKLFIIADGPRLNKPAEKEKVAETREIIENVDWECEVVKDYSDLNLGCKKRVSSGISRVFENCDEAIFLEDDCLPHQSFFRYCQELLEYYRDDERVMMISGNNFQNQKIRPYSYYFSVYSHIWGWCSWKRAWQKYDENMLLWPEIKKNDFLKYWLSGNRAVRHWTEEFDKTHENKIDTWDYQFLFSCWINHGLAILPQVNLVSNIGFGSSASHTGDKKHRLSNILSEEIAFPLDHPPYIVKDLAADKYEEKEFIFYGIAGRIKRRLKNLFSK
jgi:hypothetical protein